MSQLRYPWTSRVVFALIILVSLFLILAGCGGAFTRIYWVGNKDLEITFLVTDADTHSAIDKARIEILYEEVNFCSDRGKAPFRLVTGPNGIAKRLCKECMCSGEKSLIRNSFSIHVPGWYVQVAAGGYSTSEVFTLYDFQRQVEKGKEVAQLTVRVELQKLRTQK
jgi:hypothetical protein